MLRKSLPRPPRLATVYGHRLRRPRMTVSALGRVFVIVVVPVLAIGGLADLAMQHVFGMCTGVWCWR